MTKEEIKALIATITKENTTEQVHAEVLNAIVDAMPEGGSVFDISELIEQEQEFDEATAKLFMYSPFITGPVGEYALSTILPIDLINEITSLYAGFTVIVRTWADLVLDGTSVTGSFYFLLQNPSINKYRVGYYEI